MAKYDAFADQYHEMITQKGVAETACRYIIERLEELSAVAGRTICDIGCGQGELSCRLSLLGASVTGVDESGGQLGYAQQKSDAVFRMMRCSFASCAKRPLKSPFAV